MGGIVEVALVGAGCVLLLVCIAAGIYWAASAPKSAAEVQPQNARDDVEAQIWSIEPDGVETLASSEDSFESMQVAFNARIASTGVGPDDIIEEWAPRASAATLRQIRSSASQSEWQELCAICLDELLACDGDVRKLLRCAHVFHDHCIVAWLSQANRCPICQWPPCPETALQPALGAPAVLASLSANELDTLQGYIVREELRAEREHHHYNGATQAA